VDREPFVSNLEQGHTAQRHFHHIASHLGQREQQRRTPSYSCLCKLYKLVVCDSAAMHNEVADLFQILQSAEFSNSPQVPNACLYAD